MLFEGDLLALVIEEELPRERLVLTWHGSPPNLGLRLKLTLFFGFFLLVPCVVLARNWSNLSRGDSAVVLVLCGLWFLFFATVAVFIGRSEMYLSRLEVCDGDIAISLTFTGWLFFFLGKRRMEIERSALRQVIVGAGSESGAVLPLDLEVRYEEHGARHRTVECRAPVEALNRRAEALDLVFRMASILGYSGYLVRRSDHRRLEIELRRQAGSRNVRTVPELAGSASYELDAAVGTLPVPEFQIERFDPSRFEGPYEIREWRPGARVRIFRLPVPLWFVGLVAILGAAVGCLGGWFIAAVFEQGTGNGAWAIRIFGLLLGGVAAGLAMWSWGQEREYHFDWDARQIRLRKGLHLRELAFADVEEIVLRGEKSKRSESTGVGKSRSTRTYFGYSCQLRLVFEGGGQVLCFTKEFKEDAGAPYRMILPAGHELAMSLGVPLRWVEFPN